MAPRTLAGNKRRWEVCPLSPLFPCRRSTPAILAPPVRRLFNAAFGILREPQIRDVLRWSLPALLVGLILRVVLTVHLPYGYFHIDTPDFLTTPDSLINEHKWELHGKKTYLLPILYSLPFAIPRVPVLASIPFAQHVLGLATILLVGALCRLWFRAWKIAILPLTILTAINPFLLWNEHTLIAETTFVFCCLLVPIAGTLYARRQTIGRFVFLTVSLFLAAGARPEGKLLFAFGILLALMLHRKQLRTEWRRLAIMLAVAVATHFLTRTTQAGLLLYTSVARLTPAELKTAPGFEPYIQPMRASLQQRWEQRPQFPRVADRKAIAATVKQYLKDDPSRGEVRRQQDVNDFCLKLARETCLRNLSALPGLALIKFQLTANESPAGRLDASTLFREQQDALVDNLERTARLSKKLAGRELRSEADVQQFIAASYREVSWFNQWSDHWLTAVNALRFADVTYPNPDFPGTRMTHYGLPFYFLAALLGLVAVMFRRDQLQPFHVAWGLTLIGFFFVIMLTGNVRARFRFVFEPFWFIYGALLVECVCQGLKALLSRKP